MPVTPDTLPADAVCLLDVPVNKTCAAFTKPVDRIVGEAISRWEKIRPAQPKLTDSKTGEQVNFLFLDRGRHVSLGYLNDTLIPMLCRKAGVPDTDVRGRITSHRARSTIASQLYNAKQPMTLSELQQWLGHTTPAATQHYAKISPTKLAKSYADADYFSRNLRGWRCSSIKRLSGLASRLRSPGSTMTWVTDTVPTISSKSARIAWSAPSAHSIYINNRRGPRCSKVELTYFACGKRFPWARPNWQRSRMESWRMKGWSRS